MSRLCKCSCACVVLASISLVQSESQLQMVECDAGSSGCDSAIDPLSTLESTNITFLQLGTESHSFVHSVKPDKRDNDVNSFNVSTPDHHVLERRRIGLAIEEGTATHEDVASYARLYHLEMSRRKLLYLLHISKTAGTFFCACGVSQGYKSNNTGNCHVDYDSNRWFPDEKPSPRPGTCESLAADYQTRGITMESNENYLLPQGLCHQFWNVIIVRDPISRLFSHLSMLWKMGLKGFDPSTITVEYLFEAAPWISNNYYIRNLLGHDVYSLPSDFIDRTHLEMAKQRLRTFDVVLIQQEQNDSLLTADINRRMGWSCHGDEEEKVTTNSMASTSGGGTRSYRETVRARWSEAEWGYLIAQNSLDTELKQYADSLEQLDRHVFDHDAFVNALSSQPKAGADFRAS